MPAWGRGAAVGLAGWLLAAGGACASFGAHYRGTSGDGVEFRLYLDGGEFLGTAGALQSIRVELHRLRRGRLHAGGADCLYRFDAADRARDRIDCAARAGSPLDGVVYVRDTAPDAARAGGIEAMRCVRRCGRHVPRRLALEGAGEDNH